MTDIIQETQLRVGFVGFGNRVDKYLRVLSYVGGFVVSGYVTRSEHVDTHDHVITRFQDLTELAKASDIVFVCVPHDAVTSIVSELILHDVHIVVETPIYDRSLVMIAKQNNETREYKIIAAENWPFRPAEVLKRRIVSSGILGRVNVIVNDFRGYEYHAFAMMRMYDMSRPMTCVGTSFSTGDVNITDQFGQHKVLTENWDIGTVRLASGTTLIYNFNSIHSRSKTRGPRSLRIMCTRGSISSNDFDDFTVAWDVDGVAHTAELDVYVGMHHDMIVGAGITVAGEEFNWRVPINLESLAFDEELLSIHTMLEQIRDAVHTRHQRGVTYDVEDAFTNVLCVDRIRRSNGQLISI